MKLKATEKFNLLKEIFNHDVKHEVADANTELKASPSYRNINTYIWMARFSKEDSIEINNAYLALNWEPKTYYEIMKLKVGLDAIIVRANQTEYANPYLYNPLKADYHYVGELPLLVNDVSVPINDYVADPAIDVDVKIAKLVEQCNAWCQEVSDDIQSGLQKNATYFKNVLSSKRIRFFFNWLFGVLSGLIFAAGLVNLLINIDVPEIVDIRSISSYTDLTVFSGLYLGGLLISLLCFSVCSYRTSVAKNFKRQLVLAVEENDSKYRDVLALLAQKNEYLISEIKTALEQGRAIKTPIKNTVALSPTKYTFDAFNRDASQASKKSFAKKHRFSSILSVILFLASIGLATAVVLLAVL